MSTETIDLTGEVTPEQFNSALWAVFATFKALNDERYGWCRDWYQIGMPKISPRMRGIVPSSTALPYPATDEVTGPDLAQELREIYGRVLRHVTDTYITLPEANRIFRAANLPEYKTTDLARFYVYRTTFHYAGPALADQDDARKAINSLVKDGAWPEGWSFDPTGGEFYPSVYVSDDKPRVAPADLVEYAVVR